MKVCTFGDNMIENNSFINGNCLDVMKDIQDNSVDLIIADPPYNLSTDSKLNYDSTKKLKGFGGTWNITNEDWDTMSFQQYFDFTNSWISECKRILKPTGSMWVFGTYHNIGIVNVILQMQNLMIYNEVIWYKRNAFPNLSGRRLTASHENILWCGINKEYTFNYEYSKESSFDEDKLKVQGKQMRTVWDIPNNKTKIELSFGKHPTQKPIRLLERIIKLTTNEGDLVFTPFGGSGSECVAAKNLNRNYIGIELESKYCEIANKRLDNCLKDQTVFDY